MNGNLALQIADGKVHQYNSGDFVADGEFHHVAVTIERFSFNLLGVSFYVDGAPKAGLLSRDRIGSLESSAPLRIGGASGRPFDFWDGSLDEIQIFNRSLSSEEIADVARARSSGQCKCAVLSTSPVAWWTFDEREGFEAGDSAGHFSGPYPATLITPLLRNRHTSGKVGGALSFDGISDSMLAERGILTPDLQHGSGFTVVTWIRTSQAGYAPLITDLIAPTDAPYGYEFFLQDGALEFNMLEVEGRCTNSACSGLADDRWHLIGATVTHDPAGNEVVIRLYVDGRLAQSFPAVNSLRSSPEGGGFSIGSRSGLGRAGSPVFFKGKLDELTVFDRALAEEDFSALYTAGSAGQCKPAVRPQPCGMGGVAPCPAGQFCQFLPISLCGEIPAGGLCVHRAEICLADEDLVCGCDGKTYGNSCYAAQAAISIAYPGQCH